MDATYALVWPEYPQFVAYFSTCTSNNERMVWFECSHDGGDTKGVGAAYTLEVARSLWTALRKAGGLDSRKWAILDGMVYRREQHGAVSMTVTVSEGRAPNYAKYAPQGYAYMAHEYEARDAGLSSDESSVRIWFRPQD